MSFETVRRGRRAYAAALVAAVLGMVMAASANAAGTGKRDMPHVNLAMGSYAIVNPQAWIAAKNGYFAKCGVDVDVTNLGTAATAAVVAGTQDLTITGSSGVLPLTAQGKPAQIIYELQRGLPYGILVAQDSPYHDVTDLAGKTVGTRSPGTSVYGGAILFSNYVKQKAGQAFNISTLQSATGDFAGAILAGTIQGLVANPDSALPYIAAHKLRWLVSPYSKFAQSLAPLNFVDYTLWGLRDKMSSQVDAISRVICGFRLANYWLKRATDAQQAKAFQSIQGFDLQPYTDLLHQVHNDRKFNTITDGFITKQKYDLTVPIWDAFGLSNVDLTKPDFTYRKVVNMGYWYDSTKYVKKLMPKVFPKKK